MSECVYCQNSFEMNDTCSDEFRMWQGLVGPYYIPTVDENGVLSWTNTGDLPNPDPIDITGPAGVGVPAGGTTGQVLAKASGTDYDTEWINQEAGVDPATATPLMDGTGTVGSSAKYAREDHVHPTDTTRASADDLTALQNATLITDTASGAIASFPDGADELPIKQIIANIDPVQDLNGYDSPWPPGGGKNKIDGQDITVIASTDNQYVVTDSTVTLAAGTYTLSFTVGANVTATRNRPFYLAGSTATYAETDYKTQGRQSWAFTLSAETTLQFKWWGHTLSANCTISDFMLETGSSASSFAPYSNICPISGHEGMTVSHSGADMSNPETLPISWQSEAGTVYGGNLTINEDGSCVLTVDRAYLTDNGSLGWVRNNDGSFYVWNPGVTAVQDASGCACNYAPFVISFNGMAVFFRVNGLISLGKGWGNAFATAEDLKTAFASNPIQFVYKLATPQTYTLPSINMLETILGTNNIWTDVGDTEVTYSADTKQFILKKIAELSP